MIVAILEEMLEKELSILFTFMKVRAKRVRYPEKHLKINLFIL